MEFESEEPVNDNTVTLDFNLANNPFCGGSDIFSHPLPSEENWINTEMLAGEKLSGL